MAPFALRCSAVALSLAFATPMVEAQSRLEVHHVLRGLVCGQPGIDWRVCFDTSQILVTGEGHCVYDRRDIPCTWFGYSFEYDLTDGPVTLQCEWTTSSPINEGNPEGVRARAATAGTYALTLTDTAHYYFEPLYTGLEPSDAAPGRVDKSRHTCFHNGRKVFSVDLNLHFPER